MFRRLVLLLTIALATSPLLAWGAKGHFMVNEAATGVLPTVLPLFFHESYGVLVSLAPQPDEWRNAGPSAANSEYPDHFIDFEYVPADMPLPKGRYEFIHQLTVRDVLRRRGVTADDIGFIPWRIAEMSELLEQQWRIWRGPDLSPENRAQVEANIIHLAASLAHFAGDLANPLHATMHYNGWVGSENREGFSIDCDLHSRFETYFVTSRVELADVSGAMREPQLIEDYFARAEVEARESNELTEGLYRLEREHAFEGRGSDPGRRFAAERLGAGASLIRDLWWSTWVNSEKSRRRER